MKIIRQFIVSILVCNLALAQEQEIIPPAPETAALFRYQDYPMDYSTGLPQILIPLFTITNGSLSVPISISYHASGCKVSDVDGPIAAGWSLNVGGMVSRTINGDPDFGIYPFPSPFDTNLYNDTDLATLEQIMKFQSPWSSPGQWKDSEYDIFSYNFGEHSGKFLFKDSAAVKTPVLLPSKALKIVPDYEATAGSGYRLQGLGITDDKGVHYKFTGTESSNSGYTGYSLNRIVSVNLQDTISYSNTSTPQYRKYVSQNILVKDKWGWHNAGSVSGGSLEISNTNLVEHSEYYDISRVTEIDFRQGKLEFILNGGAGSDKDLINYIQLKDNNDSIIKKIKFNRASLHTIILSGGTTNLTTHKLTGIEIQDASGHIGEEYSFDYYASVYHPNSSGIIDPRYIDYWGYYNASGETEMIYDPSVNVQSVDGLSLPSTITIGTSQADREPDSLALKSGVLKSIYYPTGGSTTFDYEPNRYYSFVDSQEKDGPGLRVKKIITNDANGNSYKRTFKYGVTGNTESGYAYIDMEPEKEFMRTGLLIKNFPEFNITDHREQTIHSGFLPSLGELASRPIVYTSVTEYKGDTSYNEGKTIYEYDNYAWGKQISGSQLNDVHKWHIPSYKFWNTPSLLTQTDFKAIKNGSGVVTSYDEVRKVSNGYSLNTLYDIKGIHVQRSYVIIPDGFVVGSSLPLPFGEAVGAIEHNLQIYASSEYSIPVGTKNLSSTTEMLTNDDGSSVSTNTSYKYNAQNFVSEVTTLSSRINGATSQNSILKKNIFYPADFDDALSNQMQDLNMLQYKVAEKDSINNQPTKHSKINYLDWDNDPDPLKAVIRPVSTELAKGNDALELRTTYHGYDSKGNPLEVSQENGPHTYYIWGYHDTRPIAKIDNFTEGQALGIQSLINAAKTASDLDNDNCREVSCKEQELREALNNIRANAALSDSFITTYTYDPLVGTTSMTDPRGYTVFYEYDTFNRLKAVRDAAENIVSDYEYSYRKTTN